MSRYTYTPEIRRQIEQMLKQALSFVAVRIRQAELVEDFGGIDIHYLVNDVPCQVRSRYDRPIDAHTIDITFRRTEPTMLDARTYAPLMLFAWFWNGDAKHGHLIDPYALHAAHPIDSYPLRDYASCGVFYAVPMTDVMTASAFLRTGGPEGWTTMCTGGLLRAQRMLTNGWVTV